MTLSIQEVAQLPQPWYLEISMLVAESTDDTLTIALLGLQAISLEYRTEGREIRHRYTEAWQLADEIVSARQQG